VIGHGVVREEVLVSGRRGEADAADGLTAGIRAHLAALLASVIPEQTVRALLVGVIPQALSARRGAALSLRHSAWCSPRGSRW
jgi:hypothetical protein